MTGDAPASRFTPEQVIDLDHVLRSTGTRWGSSRWAEVGRLRSLVGRLLELAQWMSGSSDFDAGGNWDEGRALCEEARAALTPTGGRDDGE